MHACVRTVCIYLQNHPDLMNTKHQHTWQSHDITHHAHLPVTSSRDVPICVHFDVAQLVRGKTIHSALHHTLLSGHLQGGREAVRKIRIRMRGFHSTLCQYNYCNIFTDFNTVNIYKLRQAMAMIA